MAKGRGRPPKTLERHLLEGSFRRDRHAHLLRTSRANAVPRSQDPAINASSSDFATRVRREYRVDDPAGEVLLALATAVIDRREACARLLDGEGGLLQAVA